MDHPENAPRRETLEIDDEDIPTSMHIVGDRIADRYQLIRVLDGGGMGVVWVAHHLALDVQVAIKLLRPSAASRVSATRLLREAQAAARLDHPAILRVLDVGTTAEEEPFLVMELLDGEPLSDVLARENALDPVTAVRTLVSIADGLAAMHDKGIIHRDLKPENIFLAHSDTGRWQPKLIDFGVARVKSRDDNRRITRRGMVVGTPVYMPIEQIQGEEADPRSDVWSLTVCLYEMIAGELPFDAPNIARQLALLYANAPPSLLKLGLVDEALWSIIQRGLAPREERWSSAREMGRALAGWLWGRSVTTDVAGVSLRARWLGHEDIRRMSHAPPISQVNTARFPVPASIQALRESAPVISAPPEPIAPSTPAPVAMGPQAAPNPGALRAPVTMGPQAAPNPGALRAPSRALSQRTLKGIANDPNPVSSPRAKTPTPPEEHTLRSRVAPERRPEPLESEAARRAAPVVREEALQSVAFAPKTPAPSSVSSPPIADTAPASGWSARRTALVALVAVAGIATALWITRGPHAPWPSPAASGEPTQPAATASSPVAISSSSAPVTPPPAATSASPPPEPPRKAPQKRALPPGLKDPFR